MALISLNHDFQKFIDPAYYAEIMSKNDEAGCILKLQLIAERFLGVYLEERIPTENRRFFIKGNEILKYFDEKLMVAIAYGFPASLADALKKLNKIRNEFGHNFERNLSIEDVDSFINVVELFKVPAGAPYLGGGSVRTAKVNVDGRMFSVDDSLIAGFVISTFFLMTRAGVWLVNDLQVRGKLSLGQPIGAS